MPSLSIAGTAFNCLEWPQPAIQWSVSHVDLENGYLDACDESAALDIYTSELAFVLKQADMDTLRTVLGANRESLTLSAFGVPIFAPNVDHSGSIAASLIVPGKREHVAFAYVGGGVHRANLTFRAHAPTLLTPTPSLAALRLQKGWNGDHTWDVAAGFTSGHTPKYSDKRTDAGFFNGKFLQTTAEMPALLAYILTTARGNAFTLPTFPGVNYPFGADKGAGPFNCRIKSFSFSRIAVSHWTLNIEFIEAP